MFSMMSADHLRKIETIDSEISDLEVFKEEKK